VELVCAYAWARDPTDLTHARSTIAPGKRIGVFGGSGMYNIDGITVIDSIKIDTPFGAPSDKYVIAEIAGVDDVQVVFLPRHGQGHLVTPSEINYRANVYGMKKLGVQWALSVTAVGSLQMEYPPGDMVLVNQFIDRTQHRVATFFGDGIVSHVPFGEPICSTARGYLRQACQDAGVKHHVSARACVCTVRVFSSGRTCRSTPLHNCLRDYNATRPHTPRVLFVCARVSAGGCTG
jgi:purine nucleoside phosphorylase